jgi:Coenzyme PQQ synthesis protein D (PqqD)
VKRGMSPSASPPTPSPGRERGSEVSHRRVDQVCQREYRIEGMVSRGVGRELLLHSRSAHRVYLLNATARQVWELARAGRTADEIVAAVCDAHEGVTEETVRNDVAACLAEMDQLGLTPRRASGEGSR